MKKQVKLEDIAKKAGVSVVSVSKALSDKEGVSDETRKRIKGIALELGYTPPSTLKDMPKTGNVGIIVPSRFLVIFDSFYAKLYQKVVLRLKDKKYYGILEILPEEYEQNNILPEVLKDKKVDGIIVIGQTHDNYSNYLWETIEIPIMFLDFYSSEKRYDTILSDGYYGMYALTTYLIKNGHKKIAFVGTPLSTSSITDRYFGYRKALLEHEIEYAEHMLVKDRTKDNILYDSFELPNQMPTAFACNSDYTAGILINKLKEHNYRIPEDISVVGFDNYINPNIVDIGITTYEVDIDKMALLCVNTMIKKILAKEYVSGSQIITGALIEKDSVSNIKS